MNRRWDEANIKKIYFLFVLVKLYGDIYEGWGNLTIIFG